MYGDIKIFAGSGCPDLAQRVAEYIGIPLSPWDIMQFPNDNILVRLQGSVRGQDVYVIQSHTRPVHRNIMEMLIAVDCLNRDSAGRITVVCPYMAYSQSDKKDQPRIPITARLLADMIEVAGADRWMTIDLHSGQIQGFYKIPGDSLTAFHIIADYFKQMNLDAVVVTPDLGYAKRGRNYAADLELPLAFVEKRRVGNENKREALNLIGEVAGKDVIIVDDLVDTAGSIQQAVNLVKERGARDVYVGFTHPVLSDPAVERLRSLPIKEIVTTDTLPIPPEKRLPNMKVLTVAGLLAEVIMRTHEGRSVGELFNE
ncbi:MAG: ribose-phosphate diphosphokinase [Ardenticatenaceae bacterium]|nr:ribose-phosphate diphosphokinase [Anaerolineales bacterium]MCB8923462.1 ribose-phosphate diphosphokinase [Ardenticatenaceae bacterium]MCB8991383.1 ribose-phosphate diphosphokinase [Ardenticatenaceae bacterium]MCB9003813.1 ribose-phosphate diphosphokinase [Ardenticatenaceae bacterium]